MYPLDLQNRLLELADIALTQYGEATLASKLRSLANEGIPHHAGTVKEWVEGDGIGTPPYNEKRYTPILPSTMPKPVQRDRFGNPIREKGEPEP